jgi:hypothetical protein
MSLKQSNHGNRFFNLAAGDKVLLKDNFRMLSINSLTLTMAKKNGSKTFILHDIVTIIKLSNFQRKCWRFLRRNMLEAV